MDVKRKALFRLLTELLTDWTMEVNEVKPQNTPCSTACLRNWLPEIIKNFSTFYAPRKFITVFAKARLFFLTWDMQFKLHSSILVSSYQQHPDIPSGPSSSNCSTKILRLHVISPTHFSCHAHLLISADNAVAPYATLCTTVALWRNRETSQCWLLSGHAKWQTEVTSSDALGAAVLCLQWSPQYSVCDLCHVFLLLQVLFLVGALRNVRRAVSLWHQVTAPGTNTVHHNDQLLTSTVQYSSAAYQWQPTVDSRGLARECCCCCWRSSFLFVWTTRQ